VGDATGEYRYIEFDLFLLDADADLQLQIQNNGSWGNRWGFDVETVYNGYSWSMAGTTGGLNFGRWYRIRRDLVDGMQMRRGDRITGLAFSSDHGDAVYDRVVLLPASAVYDLPVAVGIPAPGKDEPSAQLPPATAAPGTAAVSAPPSSPLAGVTPPPKPLPPQCLTPADETACIFDDDACACAEQWKSAP
jgi:hypothetical protein